MTLMLTPFSPHVAEELFAAIIGNDQGMLANRARFPTYQEDLAKADLVEIPIQINGKLRSKLMAAPGTTGEILQEMAIADEKVREYIGSGEITKVIIVPGRLVNIVIKK